MFKIYRNKKTSHPSISLKSQDKTSWHNLEITHHPRKNDRYIEIEKLNKRDGYKTYVRKYIRHDKHKYKGFRYREYKLSPYSEFIIKQYLKQHYKKMMSI